MYSPKYALCLFRILCLAGMVRKDMVSCLRFVAARWAEAVKAKNSRQLANLIDELYKVTPSAEEIKWSGIGQATRCGGLAQVLKAPVLAKLKTLRMRWREHYRNLPIQEQRCAEASEQDKVYLDAVHSFGELLQQGSGGNIDRAEILCAAHALVELGFQEVSDLDCAAPNILLTRGGFSKSANALVNRLVEEATAKGRAFRNMGMAAVAPDHFGNANTIVADIIKPACQQGAPLSVLPAGVGRTLRPAGNKSNGGRHQHSGRPARIHKCDKNRSVAKQRAEITWRKGIGD